MRAEVAGLPTSNPETDHQDGIAGEMGIYQQLTRNVAIRSHKLVKNTRLVTGVVVLWIGLSGAQTNDAQPQPLPKLPKTVDEAVFVLKSKWLSASDRDWILRNPEERVVATLHMGFGTAVRNEFRLWGGNPQLMASCGVKHPDECSSVIIDRLRQAVRSDADPELIRQLDCQFKLSEAIDINYRGFYKLTTGELLRTIQRQIDDQLATSKASGTPLCQNSLMLEAHGKPDKACFVAADFAKDGSDSKDKTSLEMILGWLGVRNLFTASHVPPKIILDFKRKCQFPTPPYLYGTGNSKKQKK